MTSTTFSLAPYTSTTATFRAWGVAMNTALTSVGLTQTADTGQVNWTTVNLPANNTDGGYEIWRFNDTLQATVPIYMKISYGIGSALQYPRLTIQVGSVTNGSGTLSGIGLATYTVFNAGANDFALRDTWVSFDGSGLVIAPFISNPSSRGFFYLERFRNTSGVALNKGWWSGIQYSGSKNFTIVNAVDNITSTLTTAAPCLVPFPVVTSYNSLDSTGNITAFPWYFATKQGVFSSKMVLSYVAADLGYDAQRPVTHLGATRNYHALGVFNGYADAQNTPGITTMIWWND